MNPKTQTGGAALDTKALLDFAGETWDGTIVPTLSEYIAIPNKSPHFDPECKAHGHMAKAVQLIEGWCRKRPIQGLKVEVVSLGDRTPLIFMEIPGTVDDTVMLYGHLDKQPEMVGWADDLRPWKPVLKGDKLYGRGGADDGFVLTGVVVNPGQEFFLRWLDVDDGGFDNALAIEDLTVTSAALSAVPPFITVQPESQVATQGDTVTLTVVAGGTPPPTTSGAS